MRRFNWYDYGARFYDAQLGRFHTMDPLSESFQFQGTYNYAANNPIGNIDLMGMSPLGVGGDPKYTINGVPVSYEFFAEAQDSFTEDNEDEEKGDNRNAKKSNSKSSAPLEKNIKKTSRGVAFAQFEGRLGIPIGELGVTGSLQFGIMIDAEGNFTTFISPSLGACSGGGAFTGISWGIFPTAENIFDVEKIGINAGGIYAAWGKSFALEGNFSAEPNNSELGATFGTRLSKGYGGMGYVDISYMHFNNTINIKEATVSEFTQYLNNTLPKSNYSVEDALRIASFMTRLLDK